MRGQWSDDYGMHDYEYTPPPFLVQAACQMKDVVHRTALVKSLTPGVLELETATGKVRCEE